MSNGRREKAQKREEKAQKEKEKALKREEKIKETLNKLVKLLFSSNTDIKKISELTNLSIKEIKDIIKSS